MTCDNWIAAALSLVLASGAAAQHCSPYWVGNGAPISTISQARGLVVFDDGSGPMLYAAGRFVGGSYRVARWDGRRWEVINQGLAATGQTGSLAILDEGDGARLHLDKHTGVGGQWTLMRWEGSQWEHATPGLGDLDEGWPYLYMETSSGPRMYGRAPSGGRGNRVVEWDGAQWIPVGQPDQGQVARMIEFDDGSGPALYAAGTFTAMNGYETRGIAKLRHDQHGPAGPVWEPLGSGIEWSFFTRDMAVHNDGSRTALYVTEVASAGGVPTNLIARWDGQNWSDVGGGILRPIGAIVAVHTLGSFDDGRGPALYAGGYMVLAGGNVPVRRIARFDGTAWDDVGGGLGGEMINSMAVYDDGRGPSLFVGGRIDSAGAGAPGSIYGIAQWVGCPSCYANCTNSQTEPRLTVDDFTCFIDKFARGDPYVDCNQDGVRDIADFHCFIARFAEGCP